MKSVCGEFGGGEKGVRLIFVVDILLCWLMREGVGDCDDGGGGNDTNLSVVNISGVVVVVVVGSNIAPASLW